MAARHGTLGRSSRMSDAWSRLTVRTQPRFQVTRLTPATQIRLATCPFVLNQFRQRSSHRLDSDWPRPRRGPAGPVAAWIAAVVVAEEAVPERFVPESLVPQQRR